jgi:hypothetical protein
MQYTMVTAENEICARIRKRPAISVFQNIQTSMIPTHTSCPRLYTWLLLDEPRPIPIHSQKKINTMKSISFLSFVMPRTVEHPIRHEVPEIVVLHDSHVLGVSTVEALLN